MPNNENARRRRPSRTEFVRNVNVDFDFDLDLGPRTSDIRPQTLDLGPRNSDLGPWRIRAVLGT